MTKKSIMLALALVAAFAFTSVVVAQNATPATSEAPKQGVSKTAPATTETHKQKVCSGIVVSVDTVASSMVVKGKKTEKTFQIDPAAKISIDQKEAKLADVKKDQKVTVFYKVEGEEKIATEIK